MNAHRTHGFAGACPELVLDWDGDGFPLVAWMTSAREIAPFDADAQARPAVRTCGAVRSIPAAWIICTDRSPWAFGSGNPLMPRLLRQRANASSS